MNFNEYQKKIVPLAQYPRVGLNLIYPTLGLVGEAGEFAEKIKKLSRNKEILVPFCDDVSPELKEDLKKELGDVLWYIAALASELKLTLEDVAVTNINKLYDRHARGVIKSEGDNR